MTRNSPQVALSSAIPLRLNIGCGTIGSEGSLNCDLYGYAGVDLRFDAQRAWPFRENSVVSIFSSHVLEHLSDPQQFFREAWRCLLPNGSIFLRLPHGSHHHAWADITHVRPWFAESLAFLQPGYFEEIRNLQYQGWTAFFGVNTSLRLNSKLATFLRWKVLRLWILRYLQFLPDVAEELWVYLTALKRPEDVATYQQSHTPNAVNASFIMYRHDFEQRAMRAGEKVEIVQLAEQLTYIETS